MIATMNYYNQLMYASSPEYMAAYEDGYNAALRDMKDKLSSLQALQTATTTTLDGADKEILTYHNHKEDVVQTTTSTTLKHKHDCGCKHELKYCKTCDEVYCDKCGSSWKRNAEPLYTFTYNSETPTWGVDKSGLKWTSKK